MEKGCALEEGEGVVVTNAWSYCFVGQVKEGRIAKKKLVKRKRRILPI